MYAFTFGDESYITSADEDGYFYFSQFVDAAKTFATGTEALRWLQAQARAYGADRDVTLVKLATKLVVEKV